MLCFQFDGPRAMAPTPTTWVPTRVGPGEINLPTFAEFGIGTQSAWVTTLGSAPRPDSRHHPSGSGLDDSMCESHNESS